MYMTEIPFSPPTQCFLLHCKNNASLEGEDGGGKSDLRGERKGGAESLLHYKY